LKLRQSEGTVKIALSFCTSSAHMGDLTSFLAVVVCVRSPFFRVKWLILPGQPVTPRKRYSISVKLQADSRRASSAAAHKAGAAGTTRGGSSPSMATILAFDSIGGVKTGFRLHQCTFGRR